MKTSNTNLVLLAATTLVVAVCSSNNNDRPEHPPGGAVNQPPMISAIADQTGDQDTAIGPVTFTLSDDRSDAAAITATASTMNASLFPADGLVVSGTGASRTLTLTPYEGATGTADIVVLSQDADSATTTRTFKVTVNAKTASVKDTTLSTYAKGATDTPTAVNGFTFTQDADDPATFEGIVGADAP